MRIRMFECRRIVVALAIVAVLLASVRTPAAGHEPEGPNWSIVVTTAPHLPQDVWFAGSGSNDDGWHSGGSLCLNGLAQGFGPGEDVTALVDITEAGIFGDEGAPVPAGTYHFPGIELPAYDYTVTKGKTFFVVVDLYIVQSRVDFFFQEGDTVRAMYTWDYAPGRTDPHMVFWIDFGFGFVPFLNEGVMMANTQRHP